MRSIASLLTLTFLPLSNLFGAYQTFPVRDRIAIVQLEDGSERGRHYEVRRSP